MPEIHSLNIIKSRIMTVSVKNLFILFIFIYLPVSLSSQTKVWTLKACVDEALSKNVLLNQEILNNDIYKINFEQAKANRYPNLNLNDNQNFTYGRAVDPVSNQFLNQNIQSNNLALSTTVTIFNGLQNYYAIKQNKYYYDAGGFDIEKAKNDLSLQVAAAYLQVLYDYEAVDIDKEQVDASTAQVERTQKYVNAGKSPLGSLYQMQSQLAADKYAEIAAENQLALAKVDLMQLMEMPVTKDFEIEKPGINEPEIKDANTAEDIYKTAEQNQPQIKSAAFKINSADAGLRMAKGGLYPKLSVTGSLRTAYSSASQQISYQTISNLETIGYLQSNPSDNVIGYVPSEVIQKDKYPFTHQFQDNFNQFVGFSLTVPIFNNFTVKYNIDKAKINLQSVQLDEINTKNQLRKSIEQAYTDVIGSAKQYSAAKEQVKSEERTYLDMKTKYENGVATATDFIIEQNNFNKVKQALIQTKYNYLFKIKVVDFYLGKPLTTL